MHYATMKKKMVKIFWGVWTVISSMIVTGVLLGLIILTSPFINAISFSGNYEVLITHLLSIPTNINLCRNIFVTDLAYIIFT